MKPLSLLALAVLVVAGVYFLWPSAPDRETETGEGSEEPAVLVAEPVEPPAPPVVETGSPAPEEAPPAPAPEASTPAETAAAGPPVSAAAAEALALLDRWHRALPGARAEIARQGSAAVGECLRALATLLEPASAPAPAPFPVPAAAALGPDFAALARAWQEGGTAALARELGAGTGTGAVARAWQEVLVRQGLLRGDAGRAAGALSVLVRGMLEGGYARERVLALASEARSVAREAPAFLPFQVYKVQPGDSLIRIARRFRQQGLELRYGWIRLFNDKAGDTVQVGEELKIPATPLHLEVWRAARVAVLFAGEHPLRIEPVSVGSPGEDTPLGTFTIQEHDARPKWYRQDGPPLPYGDPENALGEGWMGFKEKTSYGLHGTNSEETVGSFETQGCIRFHNRAITELMELLPVGAQVVIHP